MSEIPLDETKYGKLIWPRFYGLFAKDHQSMIFRHSKYFRAAFLLSVYVFLFGVGSFFIFLLWLTLPGIILGITGIGGGMIGIFNSLRELRGKNLDMDHYSLSARGELDWDMYDNGILTREQYDYFPRKIKRGFFHFKDISKAYLTIDESNREKIWNLLQDSNRRYCAEIGDGYNEEEAVFDNDAKKIVNYSIWFVDRRGELSDLIIDREDVVDIARFESIIRQKVHDVE